MPRQYDLADIFKAHGDALSDRIHVCLPGVVESFDAETQTASVTPTVRNPIFDTYTGDPDSEDPVTIPNVPVCYPRGGGYSVYFPLNKGDHVVLVFSDLATAQWRSTGNISEAVDVRRHSMGYPFAIPGAFPDSKALKDPSDTKYEGMMVLGKDGDPTGSIRLKSGSVECGGTSPVPVALGDATKAAFEALLDTMKAAFAAVTPVSGGAPATAAITAAETGLKTAFEALIATITKGQ